MTTQDGNAAVERMLRLVALLEQHRGEKRSARVPGHGGVGGQLHLLGGPAQTRRHRHATHLGGHGETIPATFLVGSNSRLYRLGEVDLSVDQLQRDPVLVDIGGGEVLTGETLDLGQDVPGGRLVQIRPGAGSEVVLDPVDLEEIELEVSEIRPIVTRHIPFLTL